jgi:hypothetical protein
MRVIHVYIDLCRGFDSEFGVTNIINRSSGKARVGLTIQSHCCFWSRIDILMSKELIAVTND